MAALIAGLAVPATAERPWLAARGALSLALILAEQGGRKMVAPLQKGSLRLTARNEDPDETVRLTWLEGRLLGRLGDFTRARALLETVRLNLLDAKPLPAAQPQSGEVRKLIRNLGHRFEPLPFA